MFFNGKNIGSPIQNIGVGTLAEYMRNLTHYNREHELGRAVTMLSNYTPQTSLLRISENGDYAFSNGRLETTVRKQTIETLRKQIEQRKQLLTKQELEKIIYDLPKIKKTTVAEIVCLLYCFGIVSAEKNRSQDARYIAEKTGFTVDTVRKCLERFVNRSKKHKVEISLNKNLGKVQRFTDEYNVEHLLEKETTKK